MTSLTAHQVVDSVAHDRYRSAILSEADNICRDEPTTDADQPFSLYVRGLLALENLQPELGVLCLAQAAALDPANPSYIKAFHDARKRTELASATKNASDIDACRIRLAALGSDEDREDAAVVFCHLGQAFQRNNQTDEAADAYRQALAKKGDSLAALVGLGWSFIYSEDVPNALRCFEEALEIAPRNRLAHLGLQRAYGLTEDYARALREVAWFERHAQAPPRLFEQPLWDGAPLEGRTILLWADAGMGDVVQRMRYIPLVKARGARVIVECDRGVTSLLETMPGVDRVVARGMPLPRFDVQAPFSLLPGIFFQSQGEWLPARVPYPLVKPALIANWRCRLAPARERLVGVAWACRPLGAIRSVPLAAYAPLGALPGVRFINLQFGPQAAELLDPPPGMHIEQHLDESCSLVDTAALLLNLDLVISVETMIPHLAGALGVPVWMLTECGADWRWLLWTERSPWYPTMRLFRQPRLGAWAEAVDQLVEALSNWVYEPATRPRSRSLL